MMREEDAIGNSADACDQAAGKGMAHDQIADRVEGDEEKRTREMIADVDRERQLYKEKEEGTQRTQTNTQRTLKPVAVFHEDHAEEEADQAGGDGPISLRIDDRNVMRQDIESRYKNGGKDRALFIAEKEQREKEIQQDDGAGKPFTDVIGGWQDGGKIAIHTKERISVFDWIAAEKQILRDEYIPAFKDDIGQIIHGEDGQPALIEIGAQRLFAQPVCIVIIQRSAGENEEYSDEHSTPIAVCIGIEG